VKLLIVDDDSLIRKSLSVMLSREDDVIVVGEAENGAKAIELCKTQTPDVILMDIRMPEMDGISATRQIKTLYPHIRIMMLTTFDDKTNIEQALAVGADGYLLKTEEISNIIGKLRTMRDGVGVLDIKVLKKLAPQENPALEQLTPRERDIIQFVAKGLTNKEIAAELFLSEGTVRNNIMTIMEKLNVKNRTQLGFIWHGG